MTIGTRGLGQDLCATSARIATASMPPLDRVERFADSQTRFLPSSSWIDQPRRASRILTCASQRALCGRATHLPVYPLKADPFTVARLDRLALEDLGRPELPARHGDESAGCGRA